MAYGPAIDMGLMGSASVLSNYPAKYSSGQDIEHVGSTGTAMMPFSEALNVSYNIPAYWTYQTILNKRKISWTLHDKDGLWYCWLFCRITSAWWGVDPTVVQHTNGYQTLANGGKYEPWYIVDSIKDDTGNVIYQHKSTGGT